MAFDLYKTLTLAALCSACDIPPQPIQGDTAVTCELRDDGSTDELCSALYQALEAWQPAVPYDLSVDHRAWMGESWRIVAAGPDDPEGEGSSGLRVCHMYPEGQLHGTSDVLAFTIRVCHDMASDRLIGTVTHEVGHMLGLEHGGRGVMGEPTVGIAPTDDDLDRMRALYE